MLASHPVGSGGGRSWPQGVMPSNQQSSLQDYYQPSFDHRVARQFSNRRAGHHEKSRGFDTPEGLLQKSRKAGKCGRNIRFDTISQDRSGGDKALLFCALLNKHTMLTATKEHETNIEDTAPARSNTGISLPRPFDSTQRPDSPTSFSRDTQSYPPQNATNIYVSTSGRAPSSTYVRQLQDLPRLYKCGWNGCEKAYKTLNHLNAHITMQSHGDKRTPEDFKEDPASVTSSSKKHKCPYCATEFTRHHNLKSHLLTHSQEKPYVCSICDSRYRRLFDLKRHIRLHKKEQPHVCPMCDRRFAHGNALTVHLKYRTCVVVDSDGSNDTMEGVTYGDPETDMSKSASPNPTGALKTFPNSLSSVDTFIPSYPPPAESLRRQRADPGTRILDPAMTRKSGTTNGHDLDSASPQRLDLGVRGEEDDSVHGLPPSAEEDLRSIRDRHLRVQPAQEQLQNQSARSPGIPPIREPDDVNSWFTNYDDAQIDTPPEAPFSAIDWSKHDFDVSSEGHMKALVRSDFLRPQMQRGQPVPDTLTRGPRISSSQNTTQHANRLATRGEMMRQLLATEAVRASPSPLSQQESPQRSMQGSASLRMQKVKDETSNYASPAKDGFKQRNRSGNTSKHKVGPKPVDVSFWM